MNPHTKTEPAIKGYGDNYDVECYFGLAFSHPREAVEVICHELHNPRFGRVDCIVGTGISGVIMLSAISVASGVPCFVVRKQSEIKLAHTEGGSHSRRPIEPRRPGNNGHVRYVIIDDIVSTGNTAYNVMKTMSKEVNGSECAGIVTYQQNYTPFYWTTLAGDPHISAVMDDIEEMVGLRAEESAARCIVS